MVTEIVENLTDAALCCNTPALLHRLVDMLESIVSEELPTLQPSLTGLTRESYLSQANSKPDAYVDDSVDNLPGLA